MPGWGPFIKAEARTFALEQGEGHKAGFPCSLLQPCLLPQAALSARWAGQGEDQEGRPKWLRPRRGVGDIWGGVSRWPALSGYFT